jgi:biotin carboxylase
MLLISIGAGRWQSHGISCAIKSGLDVLALDGDPNALGFDIANKSAVVDISNSDLVLDTLKKMNIQPNGAVSFAAEVGMHTAARIREHYNLSGIYSEVTNKLTNKALQRQCWEEHGLPNPAWICCKNAEEIKNAKAEINFPVIVKPVDSAGSRGVTIVDSQEKLMSAAESAFEYSRLKSILIESILPGSEYTVETFSCNNQVNVLAVTIKRKVAGTNGTVADQLMTPELDIFLEQRIRALACGALDSLGLSEGPGHVEIMVTDDGKLGLIEAAGRGGGFMVFDRFVSLSSGYDLPSATAIQAVGIAPPMIPSTKKTGNVVLLRFIPSKMGTIKNINGFDDVNKVEGIEAGSFVKVGDHVQQAATDGDRLGYILTYAKDHKTAVDLADTAENLIEVEISLH